MKKVLLAVSLSVLSFSANAGIKVIESVKVGNFDVYTINVKDGDIKKHHALVAAQDISKQHKRVECAKVGSKFDCRYEKDGKLIKIYVKGY